MLHDTVYSDVYDLATTCLLIRDVKNTYSTNQSQEIPVNSKTTHNLYSSQKQPASHKPHIS